MLLIDIYNLLRTNTVEKGGKMHILEVMKDELARVKASTTCDFSLSDSTDVHQLRNELYVLTRDWSVVDLLLERMVYGFDLITDVRRILGLEVPIRIDKQEDTTTHTTPQIDCKTMKYEYVQNTPEIGVAKNLLPLTEGNTYSFKELISILRKLTR